MSFFPTMFRATSRRYGGTLALTLLSAFLVSVSGVRADYKPVQFVKEWSGTVENETLMKSAPENKVITRAAQLQELWKSWKIADRMPEVDFKKEIVVISTTRGSRLRMNASIDEKGDLRVLGVATRDFAPGFRYAIATVARQGVKTVNGMPLAQ